MRQKKQRDEGGGASWMDTYGDLVTLLLCFFVMLFASSTVNEEKWVALINSFKSYPTGSVIETIDVNAPTPGFSESDQMLDTNMAPSSQEEADLQQQLAQLQEANKSDAQRAIEQEFNQLYEQISEYIGETGLESQLLLNKSGREIYLTIVDGVLFDSGSATIREDAKPMLTEIGTMVNTYLNSIQQITVEGHTDNVPISNSMFNDNLDLSSMRANNVARFVSTNSGIGKHMFISLGRSEFDPLVPNDSPENKQKNRRVQMILLAKNVDALTQGVSSYGGADATVGEEETNVVMNTENSDAVQP